MKVNDIPTKIKRWKNKTPHLYTLEQ